MSGGLRRCSLAVLLSLLCASCGVPTDDAPHDIDRPPGGYGPGGPAPEGFGSATERLYLVRNGVLVRVLRRVSQSPTPDQTLHDLLAGPTAAEREDGLTSALSTTTVTGMVVSGRRANVAIGEGPGVGARSDEVLAYGQIVCTLTSQGPDVGTVSFSSAGQPLGVPRGDGALATGPLTIADYADLLQS
jgi:Sporulation and spore germination